jgi:hypothetical protein
MMRIMLVNFPGQKIYKFHKDLYMKVETREIPS